jgi:hypothetical protein
MTHLEDIKRLSGPAWKKAPFRRAITKYAKKMFIAGFRAPHEEWEFGACGNRKATISSDDAWQRFKREG